MDHVQIVIECRQCYATLGTRYVLKSTLRRIRATKHECACCGRVNVSVKVQDIPVETHFMSSRMEDPFLAVAYEDPFHAVAYEPPFRAIAYEAPVTSQHEVDLIRLFALQRYLGY